MSDTETTPANVTVTDILSAADKQNLISKSRKLVRYCTLLFIGGVVALAMLVVVLASGTARELSYSYNITVAVLEVLAFAVGTRMLIYSLVMHFELVVRLNAIPDSK